MTAEAEMWAKLAVPFPESEVKQRPGAAKWDHKPSCDGPRCRDTKDPAKHIQFSYVDARAVMQRLDDVLTPAGWEFTSTVVPGTDVVHGHLTVAGFVREDYGYPNSDHDDEPIKAAASDALKRCAVMFGIGRHLYDDNSSHGPQPVRNAPQRTQPAPVADDPYADLPNDWETPGYSKATNAEEDTCPEHNLSWTLKPAGVSKAGKEYGAFWKCDGKTNDEFCRAKPTKAWQARHEG